MAKGLELQLGRCEVTANANSSVSGSRRHERKQTAAPIPAFCGDDSVYGNVKAAYNELWDVIEENKSQLSGEVWSWVYRDGNFQVTPLGVLPPPGGGTQTGKFDQSPSCFLGVVIDKLLMGFRIRYSAAVVAGFPGCD